MVRPGIEVHVTYERNGLLCRLEIPSDVATKQQVDEIVEEIVPRAMRGKELARYVVATGGIAVSMVDYDLVVFTQPVSREIDTRPWATIVVKRGCYPGNVRPVQLNYAGTRGLTPPWR